MFDVVWRLRAQSFDMTMDDDDTAGRCGRLVCVGLGILGTDSAVERERVCVVF